MNLHVLNEEKLKVCGACECILPLKVWVPMKFIKDTTPTEKLHPDCWILKEINDEK
jgi:hypothetical protein